MHGLSNIKPQTLFSPADRLNTIILRRHPYQHNHPKPRSDLLSFSFRYRVLKLWNFI